MVQRQMFQHGHQMFIQNVETEVEEMFWADPNIHILHQQFAAKYIAGFEVRGAIRKRLGWRWATAVPGVSTSGCAGSLGPFLRQPELRALPPAGAQHQAVRGQAQEREELDQSRRSQSAGFAASRFPPPRPSGTCLLRPSTHPPTCLRASPLPSVRQRRPPAAAQRRPPLWPNGAPIGAAPREPALVPHGARPERPLDADVRQRCTVDPAGDPSLHSSVAPSAAANVGCTRAVGECGLHTLRCRA